MQTLGFLAKKFVSLFLYPLSIALVLLFAAIIMQRNRRGARGGFVLVLIAAVWLLLLSFTLTAYLLMHALEVEAGPYADPRVLHQKGVRYIVVLSASWVTEDLSLADRQGNSIFRVLEGIRLWKNLPESKLVLSGGSMPGRASQAEAMIAFPVELGVPREALVVDTGAWDTDDEARIFGKIVGKQPFALVTSAWHMPRAIRYFQSRGLNPVACPCEFRTNRPPLWYSWFWPSADALLMSTQAIHEYIGRLWQSLKLGFARPTAHAEAIETFAALGPRIQSCRGIIKSSP